MIQIDNTLVSDLLLERKFVCDLSACKGECCVAGDAGAPLEAGEVALMEEALPHVLPYMTEEGKAVVAQKGVSEVDEDGDLVTPLIPSGKKPCAFVIWENDVAKCAIEKAWLDKKITFQKPVSCHLYPVRLSGNKEVTLVNYHQWQVCKPACRLGEQLNVKVYRFLKEPLIRKFGEDWFSALEAADAQLNTNEQRLRE